MEKKESTLNNEELKQVSGGGFPPETISRFQCAECRKTFEINAGDSPVCPYCGSTDCFPVPM